jgi:hypothetical protein
MLKTLMDKRYDAINWFDIGEALPPLSYFNKKDKINKNK